MIYKPGDLPDLKYISEKLDATSNWLYIKIFFRRIYLCVESYRFDSSFFMSKLLKY